MKAVVDILKLLIFPGFLFILCYAWFCEWVDRKAFARFQNRVGPPWFQPFADFLKLLAKEEIMPEGAHRGIFWLPVAGMASAAAVIFYVPVWHTGAAFSFSGDLIVAIYLLSLPTLALFLAGWYTANSFAAVGAVRAVTQLISYEVPFILSLIAPAILAGSMSMSGIAAFARLHPWILPCDFLGLAVAVLALQAKLERVPFDVPEAETEIVAGPLTEFSGRGLALFHLMRDLAMAAGAAILANLFLGGLPDGVLGFPVFLLKTLVIILILALVRAVTSRLRIEQVVAFCWRWLVPGAIVQIFVAILIKGWWL